MLAGAQHQLRGLPAGAAEPVLGGVTGGGILPAPGAAAAAHDLRDAAAAAAAATAAAQLASAALPAERRQAQAERRLRRCRRPRCSSKAARRLEGAARLGRYPSGACFDPLPLHETDVPFEQLHERARTRHAWHLCTQCEHAGRQAQHPIGSLTTFGPSGVSRRLRCWGQGHQRHPHRRPQRLAAQRGGAVRVAGPRDPQRSPGAGGGPQRRVRLLAFCSPLCLRLLILWWVWCGFPDTAC